MKISNFHFQMQILLLISKNTVLDFEGLKEKLAPSITDNALTECLEELLMWGWVQVQKGLYMVSGVAYQIMGDICQC